MWAVEGILWKATVERVLMANVHRHRTTQETFTARSTQLATSKHHDMTRLPKHNSIMVIRNIFVLIALLVFKIARHKTAPLHEFLF